jgi:hypothetical protein
MAEVDGDADLDGETDMGGVVSPVQATMNENVKTGTRRIRTPFAR